MQAHRAILRFLLGYEEAWAARFPDLTKKGHWELALSLCIELPPMQAFFSTIAARCHQDLGLDEATMKERVAEFVRLGLCTLDPAERTLGARTLLVASPKLRTGYDRHLVDLAKLGFVAARAIEPRLTDTPPAVLDDGQRLIALRMLRCWGTPYADAMERVFDAQGLSAARRHRARRNLLFGGSHMLLLYAALDQHVTEPVTATEQGLLADDLAATMVQRLRQGFETTRQHIAELMSLGLLTRREGRRLHVGLSPSAARAFAEALDAAAKDMPQVARKFALTVPRVDNVVAMTPRRRPRAKA